MTDSNTIALRTLLAASLLLGAVGLTGCGESQQDLFLKHAQRPRPDAGADDQPAAEAEPAEQAAAQPVKDEIRVQATSVETAVEGRTEPAELAQAEPAGDEKTEDAGAAESLAERVQIRPIAERVPETELTVAERRKRSFENLQRISQAIMDYLQAKGRFPKAYLANSGGVPTLSWRVELLPYLGYKELYEQFDPNRPWNMSPNKDLLEYIPDEFVSPERFDVKTNYLVPVNNAFMFGENRTLTPSMIDDGVANTIMLVEVNEPHAVNWTEPKDFQPESAMKMSPYLGKVRADGTFALWASGIPVLLESGLSDMQLLQAMTYAKSDALQAKDIHRAISIEDSEADPTIEESIVEVGMSDADEGEAQGLSGDSLAPDFSEELTVQRKPVPPIRQLSAAQEKLREIYRQPLTDAKSEADKSKLAGEMIDTAAELEADPAGAYVLQRAALKLSIDAADAAVLLKAVDQRVATFEVDSFEENLKWIQEFGGATASRDSSTVKGDPIVQRAIPVIFAGIRSDQYMPASLVARIANRFTDNKIESRVSRLLSRLRTQLGSAKREYDNSVDDLERFRINPENKAAGAAFGRFLCFVKGDWQKGLPLIADGPAGDLTEVARMDLRGARGPIDQAAIGDAWWDLSERGSGIYRQGAQDRAVMWYAQAFERLPESLDRIHVKNRLQEADETDGRSPIALCMQLADELNVDLNQSLTSIAAKGNRPGARYDDDDD